MKKERRKIYFILLILFFLPLIAFTQSENRKKLPQEKIILGAERIEKYVDKLRGKQVGIVANQSSRINKTHLVDSLLNLDIKIRAIYCPEHGFRGDNEAGKSIQSSIDAKTSLPIISLYGKNKKPNPEEFQKNEIIVFDLQDVGCRFYTYISTLHYIMEACAELNIPLLVLDRPNPNADYIDGAVLKDTSLVSFVGMHPVPIVYGMTIGEYAKMINGELWLGTSNGRVIGQKGNLICDLRVVSLLNYTHNTPYSLPIAPSPNLKTENAIRLYPSLCCFEGTPISVGRGTDKPFEIIGFPKYNTKTASMIRFTPQAIKGVSDNPPYKGQLCRGLLLRYDNQKKFNLSYIIEMYNSYPNKDKFFQPFFDKLCGNKDLKHQIKQGLSAKEIKKTWEKDLRDFRLVREKYLLYE